MSHRRIALCGWALTLSLASASAEELTFIDVPEASGQLGTVATGINPRGDIVGSYVTDDYNFHGFLLRNGTFTTLDAPGVVFPGPPTTGGTFPTAINPQGDIVGYYNDSSVSVRGFLLSGGLYTTIDVPGSNGTAIPTGINARGDIVGFYFDSSGQGIGFALRDGTVSTIAAPGALSTVPWGINARGDVVGSYFEGPLFASHGFLLTREGTLTSIDVPGGTPGSTQAAGINSGGDIVGTHQDSNGFPSTWLRRGGTFTAPITELFDTQLCECQGTPMGINSRGDLVGLYYDAVAVHGFLLSK